MLGLNDYQFLAATTNDPSKKQIGRLLEFLGMDVPAADLMAANLNACNESESGVQPARLLLGALGLAGEAGEFADRVKKTAYHGHALDREKLLDELGDILWYIADAAGALGVELEEVARRNNAKLRLRYPEGFNPEASKNRVA